MAMSKASFKTQLDKVKDFFIRILSCSERPDPPLQIGYPTDFRSEDISMPGLTEAEQAFIREKAIADAQRMFATHPCQGYPIPLPDPSQMTLPHHSPPLSHHQSAIDRVRMHARKLSNKMGYHGVMSEEFASRPMIPTGDDSDSQTLGLGLEQEIGAALTKDSLSRTQSRDSVTLGGSGGCSPLGEKETTGKI